MHYYYCSLKTTEFNFHSINSGVLTIDGDRFSLVCSTVVGHDVQKRFSYAAVVVEGAAVCGQIGQRYPRPASAYSVATWIAKTNGSYSGDSENSLHGTDGTAVDAVSNGCLSSTTDLCKNVLFFLMWGGGQCIECNLYVINLNMYYVIMCLRQTFRLSQDFSVWEHIGGNILLNCSGIHHREMIPVLNCT